MSESTLVLGWRCPLCTLMNSLTRCECAACATRQPGDAVLEEYFVSPDEYNEIRTEVQVDQKIQAQKEANYKELVLLEKAELVLNIETFECPICFTECTPSNGAVLRECLHSFCKQCLSHLIEYSDEAEVKCPYVDNDYSCSCLIRDREIKALVSPALYDKHLAKCVSLAENQMENAFHCKTPDCQGWCTFEDEVNEFHCPVCWHCNCLTCQAIHDELNCKQYQDHLKEVAKTNEDARKTQEMLDRMLERREAMKCPRCEVLVMKKSGCDWLRCSMCKTEICWVTRGPRWGPGGHGDNSGGCGCRVRGRCHPQCGNCH
ncbi:hypothetical protein M8J77_018013 [Diaphorina citri]|nr:hypothetical protein M8J77_018013 [Diaphorina citri]